MKKTIANGDFGGFKINEDENVNILQFADDTVMVAEGDTTNLWTMKVILRAYEIMSGLQYLGVKVGGNPRKLAIWKDLIIMLRQRLDVWKGIDLNIARRLEFKRTVHWVSWDTVCKTREKGGLGIKNMKVMNMALLSKWKWRILIEDEAVWRGILVSRYRNIKNKVLFHPRLVTVQTFLFGTGPRPEISHWRKSSRSC
ncbi:uncharacterized protein LOC131597953 [Vicia villosa]|uniref:uncharacterized protein LOC131597953 n=1 Tax=Vicia villosa TaxID=3911 RepID=UPI00273BCFDA|nr:uncharacterized protein LOC131597953 [Vicia villosa]